MDDIAEHLHLLLDASPVLMAAYDPGDRLRYANAAYRAAYGVEAGEEPLWADLMHRNFLRKTGPVIPTRDFEGWLTSSSSRRGKVPERSFELKLHDGRWMQLTESVAAGGWLMCTLCDVSHMRQDARAVRVARDQAIRAAHTDDLTGVANRRFVTARVDDMLARKGMGLGADTTGCVCVLDLDNFKYINDCYGHQAGDTILRDFSARINGRVRRSDCFGRVGGEEFVLVLPDTMLEDAARIVNRMLTLVRDSRPLADKPDFSYSFSAGVAQVRPGDTFNSIYGRADKALYAAKLAGRNCVYLEEAQDEVATI
ncbi:GGDEF domain-containing protein [Xanthobacter sp. TB0139]|uniref:GGDEF domain-containing protein n=1 Tax=Xanthobacter sp. TB0139 TaxID=3459178 RepID=UPI004039C4E5